MSSSSSMAPPPYAQVMDDMVKGREFAAQLQGLLRESPETGLIIDQILHTFSRAIRAIDDAKANAGAEGSEAQSEVTCGKRKAAGAGERRGNCRRRAHQSADETFTRKDLDDGHAWRKYGQKEIQNSKNSRAYFRCTHKYDQLCQAQRQVQRCDDDPTTYRVTYIGVHTCRDPAAVAPHVVHHQAVGAAGSRLISFAPDATAATTTGSTTTTVTANTTGHADDGPRWGVAPPGPAPGILPPLKLEGGEQEEVVSSRTPGSSMVRGGGGAAGPDQGDVTSILQYCGGGGGTEPIVEDYGMFDLEDINDWLLAVDWEEERRGEKRMDSTRVWK